MIFPGFRTWNSRPVNGTGGGHLSENLHTFVRALGHKIQPEQDRDSKLLARLRVCPGTMSYKRTLRSRRARGVGVMFFFLFEDPIVM